MKNLVIALCLSALFPLAALAREASVITKEGQVLKGELIGINSGNLYLNTQENQAKVIKVENIAEVFDAATQAKIDFHALPPAPPAQPPAPFQGSTSAPLRAGSPETKRGRLFINGNLQAGMVGYVPCRPLEGTYSPYSAYVVGMQPYDSAWGVGVGMEYTFFEGLAGCLDAGISRWQKQLAKKGGYGVGDWVFERTGYNGAAVGPFPMDVHYYMDTTIMRLGAKYHLLSQGIFRPYLGAALGLYGWQATIGNREEQKKYSETSSGYAFAPSYQAGVDLTFSEFTLRLFGDVGTAVAYPRFENLFQPGWTFENTGGEHVEGPYRFGLALGLAI